MQTELRRWTAKRSGATITVEGVTPAGRAEVFTGVTLIRPASAPERLDFVVAELASGDKLHLMN